MGRTSQDDELDDLRANLEEDPDLADAFDPKFAKFIRSGGR
jgi:hypothetical protein